MNKDQELKLNRIIKELSNIVSAISGGGGGGSGNAIETKLLINPNDPTDNQRRVILITDTTVPATPVHTYLHVDDGTPFIGDISELQTLDYPAELAIFQELVKVKILLENASRTYYMVWDANPGSVLEIVDTVSIDYKVISGGIPVLSNWNDSGTLTNPYVSMAAILAAINGAQSIVEFYELTNAELLQLPIDSYVIGIRSNSSNVPIEIDNVYIALDSTSIINEIHELPLHITALDEIRNLLNNTFGVVENLLNEAFIQTDNLNSIIDRLDDNIPYHNKIARGLIDSVYNFYKFGFNDNIDTGVTIATPATIWFVGGPYTGFTTNPEKLRIKAGGNALDAAAGTGAQTIIINGLDASGDQISEVVTTNGVIASTQTAQDFSRAHSYEVLSTGSDKRNAGDIIVEGVTSTAIYGGIPAGFNRSQQTTYTVPRGFQLELEKIVITSYGANNTDVSLVLLKDTAGNGIFQVLANFKIDQTSRELIRQYNVIICNALDNLKIDCISTTGNDFTCSAEFHGTLKQL